MLSFRLPGEARSCEGHQESGGSPEERLAARLRALGLPPVAAVRTHTNRTVMVSLTAAGVLRLHRGYAHAPDRVLGAIVRFLSVRHSRAQRRAAERVFLAFPVEEYAPPSPRRRVDRPHPGDVLLIHRLTGLHHDLNRRHFHGRLHPIPIRISGRMRTRLGEVSVDLKTGRPLEIAISRLHLVHHAWSEVEHTLLHEMVHQWQAETGHPVDHGPSFRRKAAEVGVEPKARRRVGARPGRAARS